MKRLWITSLMALAAVVGVASAANAQINWKGLNDAPPSRSAPSPMNLSSWGVAHSQDVDIDAQPSLSDAPMDTPMDAPMDAASDVANACGVACAPVAAAPQANWVVGVTGLYFTRDSEDDIRLTRNGAGDILLSTSANMNGMGGNEVDLTRRGCNGSGIQLVYWGLYPGESFSEILGPGLSTYIGGLDLAAVAPGAQPLATFFDNADSNYAYRTNEIYNVEANLLRNVGSYKTRHGRNATYELLGGFRWFQFNENFGYGAFNAATVPNSVEYDIDVENTLLGFQLGGRSEYCITNRLSASIGAKVGAFNNYINHNQTITDNTGAYAYRTAAGVDDYAYASEKNDFSMLGELNFGMSYRVSGCSRLVFGYRVLGISGIALAPDQIPNDFTLDAEINAINSNNDLIVGGGYGGLEFCF